MSFLCHSGCDESKTSDVNIFMQNIEIVVCYINIGYPKRVNGKEVGLKKT